MSPLYPRNNGFAGQCGLSVKVMLCCNNRKVEWDMQLSFVEVSLGNMQHITHGVILFRLFFSSAEGYDPFLCVRYLSNDSLLVPEQQGKSVYYPSQVMLSGSEYHDEALIGSLLWSNCCL